MGRSGQNLEAQGLTGKILRNKDLASILESCNLRAVPKFWKDRSRIFPILFSSHFSVKVVRHRKRVGGCGKKKAVAGGAASPWGPAKIPHFSRKRRARNGAPGTGPRCSSDVPTSMRTRSAHSSAVCPRLPKSADIEYWRPTPVRLPLDTRVLVRCVHISPYSGEPFGSSITKVCELFGLPGCIVEPSKLLLGQEELLNPFDY
jgi:hypothetical protein